MGTSPNPVSFVVTDNIAPSIAPNLAEISKQSRSAQNSLQALRSALAALDNSGTSGIRQALRDISSSTTQLSRTTSTMGTVAQTTSLQINKLSSSYQNLNFSIQATIGTMNAFAAAASTARVANNAFAQSSAGAGVGASGMGAGAQQGAVALKVLEGSAMGATRAAGAFLTQTLGLGPVLRAAFPIIGALALIEVLGTVITMVKNVANAYRDMSAAAVKASADAALAGEKILKAKPEGLFSAAGVARLIQGDYSSVQDTEVVNVATKLRDLARETNLLKAQARNNEAGLQGLALQKQRVADLEHERDLIGQQKFAIDELTTALYKQATATHDIVTPKYQNPRTGAVTPEQRTSISDFDPAQLKVINNELAAASEAGKNLDNEFKILKLDIEGAGKKESLAGLKDDLKAAHEQLKSFREDMAQLKSGPLVSPQDELNLLLKQRKQALPGNVGIIDTEIGAKTQEIDRQGLALQELAKKYHDQVEAVGLYSDALKIQHEIDKIDLQVMKERLDAYSPLIAAAKEDARQAILNAGYERDLQKVYEQFAGPLRNFNDAMRATNKLEADGAITTAQATQERRKAGQALLDFLNPLNEYLHGLQLQHNFTQVFGEDLIVTTELQRVQEQLRKEGIVLGDKELQQLKEQITKGENEKELHNELNKIYNSTTDALRRLTVQQQALNAARDKGLISLGKYQAETAKLKVETADLNIEMGKFGAKDVFTSVFGSYIKSFQGFATETTGLLKNMFATFADGAANAISRAIFYGESLGAALKDVARTALSELISGMIKLGVQMLISHFLGRTLAKIAVAESIAEAAIVGVAWAGPAALVNTATLGGAAIAGDITLLSAFGIANAIAAASVASSAGLTAGAGFSEGGIVRGPGSTTSDSIPAWLSNGESVLNARATQLLGESTINALNSNGSYIQKSGSVGTGSTGTNVSIVVQHDGSTAVEVHRFNENEIRIIARQEAKDVATTVAPQVISQQIQNPNSQVSKNLQRHTDLRPRR